MKVLCQIQFVLSRVGLCITYRRVWTGWLDLLTPYTFNPGLQVAQRYCWFTHFIVHRYTCTRVLSLHKSHPGNEYITVLLSLQITYEVFPSQPNSLLVIILQLPTPKTRLSSISLLVSSYLGRLASRNGTDTNDRFCPSYNPSARTMQKTQPLYCWEGVFTASLHSTGSYSIVACVFVAAGMCL
jgi:hypothetical protein